ncbi:MAG TPA: bile acid:sodium symporter [Pirellulales bacterium]|nr:bile acid:sodium symporter [Pirellulales bacterium]
MTIDRWVNSLIVITLIEMMIAIGLGVAATDVVVAARRWQLTLRAAAANYLLVPAATIALLRLYHATPMVAAGFLILAACPGAPYGPPFTAIAKGNVATSVGLMVILASSSAIVAPLLLSVLLPLVSSDVELRIEATRLIATLFVTQLLPLCAGLGLRVWRPKLAAKMQPPASLLSKIFNLVTIGLILATRYQTFLQIRLAAFAGMLLLLIASLGVGWLLGGSTRDDRRAMALTTALRNVGVSMVIAAGSFPGTPALTAVLAYALVELAGSLALALWWARRARGLEAAGTLY